MSDSKNKMMTTNEVAELMKVSISTVRSWRNRGIGPRFLKTESGMIRYHRADVERWMSVQ